jgi:hypothetical protein
MPADSYVQMRKRALEAGTPLGAAICKPLIGVLVFSDSICSYQTRQALVGIMGWPGLQSKALPNSGIF